MKISVIVPVYGVEKYIERCVKSLLEQTYTDKEIIFVNDVTKDSSVEIINQITANYPLVQTTVLHHNENRGLAAARKTGLVAATGEYIVSVDGDDYLEKDALEVLAQKSQETNADIIGMNCWFEWYDKKAEYKGRWVEDPTQYSALLLSGATLPGVCLHMIRKELYNRADIWPIEGLNNGEDYVTTPRLAWYANRIAKVEKPLYHYIQTNSASIVHVVSESNIIQLTQAIHILTAFFSDKKECARALSAGQWLKKTDMMMRAQRSDYCLVDAMPTSMPVVNDTMTNVQRIAVRMIVKKQWTLLWFYSRICSAAIELLQILKGRRKAC